MAYISDFCQAQPQLQPKLQLGLCWLYFQLIQPPHPTPPHPTEKVNSSLDKSKQTKLNGTKQSKVELNLI